MYNTVKKLSQLHFFMNNSDVDNGMFYWFKVKTKECHPN